MELQYKGQEKFVMFPNKNLRIKDGTKIVTNNKEEIKEYKNLGFKEVKEAKKEEGGR